MVQLKYCFHINFDRLEILRCVLKQLNTLSADKEGDLSSNSKKILINSVVTLLDYVEPEEEESLNAIQMFVRICEALCIGFGKSMNISYFNYMGRSFYTKSECKPQKSIKYV